MDLVEQISHDSAIQALARHISSAKEHTGWAHAKGVWGSSAPLVAACLGRLLKRPILFLTAHIDDADNTQDDLDVFAQQNVELFPAWELIPEETTATDEVLGERLRLCRKLLTEETSNLIISSSVLAMLEPLPSKAALKSDSLSLRCSSQQDRDQLLAWLIQGGYERTDMVEVPGEFAARGGIVDVFVPGWLEPARIEFFDDTVESIRKIDLDTQRSSGQIDEVELAGASYDQQQAPQEQGSLVDYLPPETIIIWNEPAQISETAGVFLNRVDDPHRYHQWEDLFSSAASFYQIQLSRFGSAQAEEEFSLRFGSLQRFETSPAQALPELTELAANNDVYVYCDNPSQRQRLEEMFEAQKLDFPARLNCPLGFIHQGFRMPGLKIVVAGHHEIFHRYERRRRIRRLPSSRPIDSFAELNPSDYVVHVTNGIGRFEGLQVLERHGRREEFLSVRFGDGVLLHVPTSRIDLIQRYIGGFGGHPPLSKLGTGAWRKQRDKAQQAVTDLASELLELQARRQAEMGDAYPPDTPLQKEFEASFIYQETVDQLTALQEIKADLCQARPMERLLCGDVGYGKTELAIRAAFKVVEAGRQVAILVPTTVLAQQHYKTFTERLADYPFLVEVLSRFRTAAEQKKIIARAMTGRVDIVIGTHRLLSKDMGFANLGLVIIDEEQRFGVEHKEKLKQLRETVEVLTMTATPIPRTLHMGLLGLRDISSLTSPPQDRRSIVTEVCPYDKQRIRSAILRELNRDGQVYFLHNRVHSIQAAADQLADIVPEARIGIGHGQMPKRQLEQVMLNFVAGQMDVLVCTTIIESGLDIPTVNTIIITDADRFGLAELHQLRGRVGRYKHRAYAYMMLPKSRPLLPTATKRLKAIEEYSELGAGFRIALRDLEIRGAGNILGAQQSGHIQNVGYEMYCQLLKVAVAKLKGETTPQKSFVHLELGIAGLIDKSYVASDRQRVELYRRLARAQTLPDLEQLEQDLKDMFGPLSRGTQRAVDLAELRILASRWRIKSIIRDNFDLVFTIAQLDLVESLFKDTSHTVRIVDAQTVYMRLEKSYFAADTLLAILRKLLKKQPK